MQLSARSRAALGLGRLAGAASRRSGRGAGEVVSGTLALRLDPTLMAALARGRVTACVSGTNGKTTTTRLLAAAMSTAGRTVSNAGGANMSPGVTAALMSDRLAGTAVLEVDEMYLPAVTAAVAPRAVVLLNITRDQLDRSNETRRIAGRWRSAGGGLTGCTAVANVDDPLVVWAALGFDRQLWVSAGQRWVLDACVCPSCGGLLERAGGDWSCPGCGLRRPQPQAEVLSADRIRLGELELELSLAIPGEVNTGNACLALAAAQLLGADPRAAAAAFSQVRSVQGRYSTVRLGGVEARLLLAKNPAGWLEMLALLEDGEPRPVVLAFNARTADGRDPSWIWDVPLERLAGRPVVVCGDRAADLAARLAYAGVEHQVAGSAAEAAALAQRAAPGAGTVDVIATYTAFRELQTAAAA